MPIRPENKARYPKDWKKISERIRFERAGNKCEKCGVRNGAIGGRTPLGEFRLAVPKQEKLLSLEWPKPGEYWFCEDYPDRLKIIRIVLTVAHLDHTPENCSDDNLMALCQRCHLRYDQNHHRACDKTGKLL